MNKNRSSLVLLFVVSFLTFMVSCQNKEDSDYQYSEEQMKQFLIEITKNAVATITDITTVDRKPTNKFEICTRYPLSEEKLNEYKQNNGTIVNRDDDISDFATYTVKDFDFTNERNEKLRFVDNGDATYLQEYGLWEYTNTLHQNLGIELTLNDKFEKLKGHVTIEFIMPGKIKKEVRIPVNISIYDKVEQK